MDVWLLGGLRPPEIASSFALVVIVDEKFYLKKESMNNIFIPVQNPIPHRVTFLYYIENKNFTFVSTVLIVLFLYMMVLISLSLMQMKN